MNGKPYRCQFFAAVRAARGAAYGHKQIDLPFVPQPGDIFELAGGCRVTAEAVVYSLPDDEFQLELECLDLTKILDEDDERRPGAAFAAEFGDGWVIRQADGPKRPEELPFDPAASRVSRIAAILRRSPGPMTVARIMDALLAHGDPGSHNRNYFQSSVTATLSGGIRKWGFVKVGPATWTTAGRQETLGSVTAPSAPPAAR